MYRDHLAQERPPEQWAIDFGEAFSDVVTNNTGPALRRGLARLMQHPQYRDAVSTRLAEMINKMLTTLSHSQQGTDDHFMSALFAAGAAGSPEDSGKKNYAGAECWELLNMRNVSTHTHTQTRHQKKSLAHAPHPHFTFAVSVSVWRLAKRTTCYPHPDGDSGGSFYLRGYADRKLAIVPPVCILYLISCAM
jgi:hypothetical protein